MNRITTYFFGERRYADEAALFKKAMAFFVLYKCLYWLLDFKVLFSANNIIYHNNVQLSAFKNAVFLLFNHPTASWSLLFLIISFVAAICVLCLKRSHGLFFLVLWFTINNIHNNVFCTMTGGDSLFQLLLFFCIFLSGNHTETKPFWFELRTALHNFGILAIHIQICIVYFLNALAKLTDTDWLNGNAVADSLALKEFSLSFLYDTGIVWSNLLGYSVIIYQLMFPVLVWIRKIKKWYLLIGVIQHLFIAFAMGLPSFGMIMILAYAAFYSPFKKT